MTTLQDVQDCLSRKRLAFAGVSRSEKDFTRTLFRELVKRGYDPVPVHPSAHEIEGRRAYAKVQQIDPPVEWVLIATPPKQAESVVLDCAEAGVKRVWLYRAVGKGSVSRAAVSYCRNKGIRVVEGYCPYAFWPDVAWYHKLHGALLKITARWPQ